MNYSRYTPSIKQHFVLAIAIMLSVVMATSMPVKALTLHQALIGGVQELKDRIDSNLDASIAAIKQNEKDMAALGQKLNDARSQVHQAVMRTRDDINKYIAGAHDIKDRAERLVQRGVTSLNQHLKAAGTTAEQQLQTAINDIKGFVKEGKAIVEEAKELAQQGAEQLNQLEKNADKYTKEQFAYITKMINAQVSAASDMAQKIEAQIAAGIALIDQGVVSAAEGVGAAIKNIEGFIEAGKAIAKKAGDQVVAGVGILQDKLRDDLHAMKNAVKVSADKSGASIEVALGSGIVLYAGISIPPEVAQKLHEANEKAAAALASIQKALRSATDPNVIKAKIKEAVKLINDAALTSVYARTTKAINSQVAVMDSLQVNANALQAQINKLQKCIRESLTDAQCSQLRTEQNSVNQGASLQAKIKEIRTNIETVRAFLSASVNLVALLKSDNYKGTLESLTTMTTMMSSISNLSGDLRNDLNNLSNAVNK